MFYGVGSVMADEASAACIAAAAAQIGRDAM